MECDIVIREARPQDERARAELIQNDITSYDFDAIVYFVFQELTLQLSVLSGAVLFIFAGAPLSACVAAPLVLGALAAGAVLVAHRALARQHALCLRSERVGFVAEVRSSGRLVGTLSVSECRGAPRSGWMHAFALAPRRGGRGGHGGRGGRGGHDGRGEAARALLGALCEYAARRALDSVETALSALQCERRAALHAAGWRLRGSYHRRVLGRALTLPMLRLSRSR